jgi:hypothetical protein
MLQIPLLPEITGSSPLWMQMEEMLNPAPALHHPKGPSNLSALHFLGQISQDLNSSNGSSIDESSTFILRNNLLTLCAMRYALRSKITKPTNSTAQLKITDICARHYE